MSKMRRAARGMLALIAIAFGGCTSVAVVKMVCDGKCHFELERSLDTNLPDEPVKGKK